MKNYTCFKRCITSQGAYKISGKVKRKFNENNFFRIFVLSRFPSFLLLTSCFCLLASILPHNSELSCTVNFLITQFRAWNCCRRIKCRNAASTKWERHNIHIVEYLLKARFVKPAKTHCYTNRQRCDLPKIFPWTIWRLYILLSFLR
jgi:hypothetical protein